MSNKPNSNARQSSLLAAIQRKAPAAASPPPKAEPLPPAQAANIEANQTRVSPQKSERGRVGSPVQFWFHDEDRLLLRELAAWLAGQGLRSTDSMVMRAALRSVKTGGDFLEAYRRASELDGRLKRHRIR
jgi:hypothetical protein